MSASGMSLELEAIGVRCLYAGVVALLASLARTGTSNVYTTGALTFLAGAIPLRSGGFICPSSGGVSGTLRLSPAQTVTIDPGPAIPRLTAEFERVVEPFDGTDMTISNDADTGDDDFRINEIGLSDAVAWEVDDADDCVGDELSPRADCSFTLVYFGDDDERPRTVTVTVGTSVGPVSLRVTVERVED
ncbi:MAG TPA: hypothetical protein VK506_15845 [Conexibacter sp.]|nr:hypothetical protein [Conexibacter sp.]